MMSYPMKLVPITVEAVWGGARLMNEKWNKKALGANVAESWELACLAKGASLVVNGEFSSRRLSGVLEENPEFLGEKGKEFSFFPILVKLIDSKGDLSIQVHPDDEYALREEANSVRRRCGISSTQRREAAHTAALKSLFPKRNSDRL